ncbi:polyketide synthase [Histoplasma capsulatum H143]|uniref:Polyketide synthase n=1 Tax=Ajellomyces capsulatus (strain H143) TaxID=544712 RepID=C6HSH5_AJECH|nr:polyketide synthase [Histoplasma capsulatum H143]
MGDPFPLTTDDIVNGDGQQRIISDVAPSPIAICGMALRLPGGIHSSQDLWDFLLAKGDSRGPIPETRYRSSAFVSRSKKPGTVEADSGYFLDSIDLGCLDASFFSMTQTELERTDPQQRQLLEVARECLENAGETNWRGSKIGCYIGSFGEDWCEMMAKDPQHMTIRTGCSSAIIALHDACDAIHRGDCTSAIVGGSNLIMTPAMTSAMMEQGVLSPDGSCKTFDAAANGYARGEAINAIFIKPLSDALRDKNPIRAIIRSTSTNCDGKTPGLATPSSIAHEDLIRRAYQVAGIKNLSETGFVECHGTGTAAGDPLETRAVGNVFGDKGVYIGSIKPNVGHSEGASGISSLIKVVLALENRTIPPNIKFSKPNPKIPFAECNLKVPMESIPWPQDKSERASINSFGVGGANAHVILESAAMYGIVAPTLKEDGPCLLVYSANTQLSLKKQVENHREYLERYPNRIYDLAYTLGRRREHLPHRSFSVIPGDGEPIHSPLTKANGNATLTMVFTGQGAQWPEMGLPLMRSNIVFRQSIQAMDKFLQKLPDGPAWTIEAELALPADRSNIHKSEYSQPLSTALQIALVETFASVGIEPTTVIGHSSGEIAAAFAAGALTASEAIQLAYYRGLATVKYAPEGAMAAIGLGWDEVTEYLLPDTVVACENSPASVTIAGERASVQRVIEAIKKSHPSCLARMLKVGVPYHSPHMNHAGEEYHKMILKKIESRSLRKCFISSVTGAAEGHATLDASYWVRNMLSPVRFRGALEHLLQIEKRANHFLEIGPHETLMGPLRQILSNCSKQFSYTPAMVRQKNSVHTFLSAIGNIHIHGIPVDFSSLTPTGSVLVDLPSYPWDHQNSYWYESRLSREWRLRKHPHHDLLGVRLPESTDLDPSWRNVFHIRNAPWIRDHKMRHVGLNYGPAFTGLENIQSSTTAHFASANVSYSSVPDEEIPYPLHPTVIDFSLQLFGVAMTRGVYRKFSQMALPTRIDTIDIYNCTADMHLTSSATTADSGAFSGHGDISSDGKAVLRIRGLKFSTVEEELFENLDKHAASRLIWAPDIDFLDPKLLFQPPKIRNRDISFSLLSELTTLCVMENERRVDGLTSQQEHFNKYHLWMKEYVNKAEQYLGSVSDVQSLDVECRILKIQELKSQLLETEFCDVARAMTDILDNCEEIFQGTVEPLEILMKDDILTKIYRTIDSWDRSAFLALLGHSKPNMKILEVGAGTGATTQTILSGLRTKEGNLAYSKYTYTDISAGFFSAAKERFKEYPNLHFSVLDISKDPISQDFAPNSFDLVVATNVLHATPSLYDALKHINRLLKPDGRLLLQELWSLNKFANYIWGTLPGWWMGGQDGRPSEPYVSPEEWRKQMILAGFNGLDSVTLDAEEPYQLNVAMVARPLRTPTDKPVTLLYNEESPLLRVLENDLTQRGIEVSTRTLEDKIVLGEDIISLIDTERPFFHGITAESFEKFQSLMTTIGDAHFLWITRSSQMKCKDPRFAQSIGVARTLRSELLLDIATCEIDDTSPHYSERIIDVFDKFRSSEGDRDLLQDYEFAISDGKVHLGRFHPFSVNHELQETSPGTHKVMKVKPGRLNTLAWANATFDQQLGEDEVEIEVRASGLNFTHVILALGIIEPYAKGRGGEITGVVKHVGRNVKTFCIGDRVAAFPGECFATTVRVRPEYCVKLPDGLSFEDAATMPCVYGTVIYSLIHVARLEKGQSILIHSACGGVGIAAIQLSQMIGAEVYATVGSQEKVEHLVSAFGIPRAHIFSSHDSSFRNTLLQETNGRGVDVVLNSLSGELLHASWECVAEFGKLIEIGKRDLHGRAKLAMNIFEANRSYCCVDLSMVVNRKPTVAKRLLEEMISLYEAGNIQPIRPIHVFPAKHMADGIRYMQKGQHIGKIVIAMSDDLDKEGHEDKGTMTSRIPLALDPESSYLLVGGLGGLGKAIASWMIEHGARSLVFLSRNAGKREADQHIRREFESEGCVVHFVAGDVSDMDVVKNATNIAPKAIRGVIHLSMVLQDEAFREMTYGAWDAAVAPKVTGTWNLHEALDQAELDFFILFSSISGIVGFPGQANYASANSFLDAFVQFRHSLSKPASVLDIGVIEDVGYIARTPGQLSKWRAGTGYGIREQELLDGVQLAILQSRPASDHSPATPADSSFVQKSQIVLAMRLANHLTGSNNRALWRKDRRMAIYHNVSRKENDVATSSKSAEDDKIRQFLQAARANPEILKEASSSEFLAEKIARKLFDFLLKSEDMEINLSCSLEAAGVDSLVAIELRNWWKHTFGFDVTILELLGANTILGLGEQCANGLWTKMMEDEERARKYLDMKVV